MTSHESRNRSGGYVTQKADVQAKIFFSLLKFKLEICLLHLGSFHSIQNRFASKRGFLSDVETLLTEPLGVGSSIRGATIRLALFSNAVIVGEKARICGRLD